MRIEGLMGVAALAAATGAQAASPFDSWLGGLDQNGWRLVAISEAAQQALLLGPARTGADGRKVTLVRYELMAPGPYRSLVAADEVDCATRQVRRVQVTGYPQNNMAGAAVAAPTDGPAIKIEPNSFKEAEVRYACGTAIAAPVKPATASGKAQDDPERMICRTENAMGTLVPKRVCRRQADILARQRADSEAVEKAQREIPSLHGH